VWPKRRQASARRYMQAMAMAMLQCRARLMVP